MSGVGGAFRAAGALRAIGLVLAAVGLGSVVVMFIGDGGSPAVFTPFGHGGAERLIVYPPMIWLMIHGGSLLGRPFARSG